LKAKLVRYDKVLLSAVRKGLSVTFAFLCEAGYRLEGPGSIPGTAMFFSSLQRPDRLWGTPSLISNSFHGVIAAGA
jgi:hypothetical protein